MFSFRCREIKWNHLGSLLSAQPLESTGINFPGYTSAIIRIITDASLYPLIIVVNVSSTKLNRYSLIASHKFGSHDYWWLCNSVNQFLLSLMSLKFCYLLPLRQNAFLISSFPTTLDSLAVSKTESILCNMHKTSSMVSVIIIKLDPHKACGFVDITAIVLKKWAPELASVHSKLYNKCIVLSLVGNTLL